MIKLAIPNWLIGLTSLEEGYEMTTLQASQDQRVGMQACLTMIALQVTNVTQPKLDI